MAPRRQKWFEFKKISMMQFEHNDIFFIDWTYIVNFSNRWLPFGARASLYRSLNTVAKHIT